MTGLHERFRAHVTRARLFRGGGARATAVLAVSGGVDSVALLDLMHAVAEPLGLDLVVAHADHGVQPGSGDVAAMVRWLAARYDRPVVLGELRLGAATTETAARRARYAWLREQQWRHGARFLVTAHQRDDQMETVLLRVLRGSAPAGLAGMAGRARGGLVRPLLPFTRAELAAHARDAELPTHDDPANRDARHLRSWVRQMLVPLVVDRLGPGVRDDLLAVARHAARDRRAWRGVLDLLPALDLRTSARGFDVARGTLARYDAPVAVALLRAAARRVGLVLGPRRAGRIAMLARGPSGRRLELGAGWVAEAALERLAVCRAGDDERQPAAIPAGAVGALHFGVFRVEWRPEPAPARVERAGWTTWITGGAWLVRGLAAGDRVAPLRGVGRRDVRRLLSDARVPRAERPGWPLVARGETILWVPGVCRGTAALPLPGTEAVRVDVIRDHGR